MAKQLQAAGYDVLGRVTSGKEAVRKALDTNPDLILMDINLEGTMNGIEATEIIRSQMETTVIYLTAHTAQDVFQRAKLTEPHAFLTKPVSPHELERTVEMALFKSRMERKLKESEARYRELVEAGSNAVVIYRAVDNGTDFEFVDFNRAGEKIEQVSRDTLIGKRLLDVFPGVQEFGLFDVLQRVWKTGVPEQYPVKEYKDNRIRGWRDNFVYRLPSGEVVAVYSDETARKRAEEDLAADRERLAVTLRSIGDGVISTDNSGRIVSLNLKAEELTGWKEEDALGKPLEEVFHIINQQSRVRCENPAEKVLLTGETVGLANNTVLIGKDGTERVLSDSGAPIQGTDGSIR